jgi:hypothetical protein
VKETWDPERRRDARYPFLCELKGTELSSLGSPQANPSVFRGRAQNISSGGLCVVVDEAVEVSRLIRCEIRVASVPVAIPLVMQVRWSRRMPEGYAVGTSFVL